LVIKTIHLSVLSDPYSKNYYNQIKLVHIRTKHQVISAVDMRIKCVHKLLSSKHYEGLSKSFASRYVGLKNFTKLIHQYNACFS